MSGKKLSPLFTWRGALCESDLSSSQRLVGLVLSLHMSERGDSCYPSQKTLAAESGLSKKTVVEAIKVLEDEGWLRVRHGGGMTNGRGITNIYEASVPEGVMATPYLESTVYSGDQYGVTDDQVQAPDYTGERQESAKEDVNTARDVLKEAIPVGAKIPKQFAARLGKEAKALIDEGLDFGQIVAAAKMCFEKGLSPANLPSLYVQAGKATPSAPASRWDNIGVPAPHNVL